MKWFDPDRGTGLISQQGAGPDVSAETAAIHGKDRSLRQGEEVLFNITLDDAGLRADNIQRTARSQILPSTPNHAVTLHSGTFYPWSATPHVP
ncbi:cold shock domain-containing protein [Streptomyces sp. NBC_00513]|uniref:cold shock domain-containing protein n=1 Tax=unclassified Streptomyces TaxID=2593676 RepID=UPI00225A8FDF|nr:cold shock domain-containing protein [Streptomyces sp. NBC_00424]MCX5071159.1 cold shock domain-containing protein [Streptomyces sp. NBC_00424]WUD45423.1 cold shock domain-containing protein [Streptomyces sp. NBC_00513]